MTPEEAIHVASNPDGCDPVELMELARLIAGPDPLELWPDRPMGTDSKEAHGNMRIYCLRSVAARSLRETGQVSAAIKLEALNEELYEQLPFWAKW